MHSRRPPTLRLPSMPGSRQDGMALVFVLIMISIVFVIAAASSRVVTLGERAARNDRDRQVAFQAAEAALSDAELDIMGPNADGSQRVAKFGTQPANDCSPGKTVASGESRGYCAPLASGAYKDILTYKPSGRTVTDPYDPSDPDTDSSRKFVYFGEFTGQYDRFPTQADGNTGAVSFMRPRYIIEQSAISFRNRATTAGKPFDAFVVTAIGYGLQRDTQVVLQAVISKPVPTN